MPVLGAQEPLPLQPGNMLCIPDSLLHQPSWPTFLGALRWVGIVYFPILTVLSGQLSVDETPATTLTSIWNGKHLLLLIS